MKYRTLRSGDKMPMVGIGTFTLSGDACYETVLTALEEGYTHIDSAEYYQNHTEVARAIQSSGVPREELFITTKVFNDHLKYADTLKACETALLDLAVDYIDLYLIHWPEFQEAEMPETFRALAELHESGVIRNVGVSNFIINHLRDALAVCKVPVEVNQVEFHPYLNQTELLAYCDENQIVVTAHTPLAQGKVFEDPQLQRIADSHDKSLVQIVLKWMVDRGIVVIPRSSSREHIRANLDLFDWELDPEITALIDGIETTYRLAYAPFFDSGYDSKYT